MQYYSPYYDFNYGYDTVPSTISGSVVGILLIFMLIYVIAFVVSITRYVLMSIGLYKIAKRRNINNAFLAFIPFANSYLLGSVYDDVNRTMNNTTKNATKLLALNIAASIVTVIFTPFAFMSSLISSLSGVAVVFSVIASLIGAVSFVLSIIYYVFYYISVYGIFKEYAHDKAVLYLVLSIIFYPLTALFMFLIRNNPSGFELWQQQREQQERVTTEVKFDEVVTETSVEEIFGDELTDDDQEQTIIEQNDTTEE